MKDGAVMDDSTHIDMSWLLTDDEIITLLYLLTHYIMEYEPEHEGREHLLWVLHDITSRLE